MPSDVFEVPFTPEECKGRLEAATEKDRSLLPDWKFNTGVLARIQDETFRLRLRRGGWHNSFDRVFYGRLTTTTSGAVITGDFRPLPFVAVFRVVWFSAVSLFAVLISAVSLTSLLTHQSYVEGNPWPLILAPWSMLLLGGAVQWLGSRLSRSCEDRLRTFICETLHARRTGT